jgi:hypothetical protein
MASFFLNGVAGNTLTGVGIGGLVVTYASVWWPVHRNGHTRQLD